MADLDVSPKLAEGVAELLIDGRWVEATTDEYARASAKHAAWIGHVSPLVLKSSRGDTWTRIATFVDGRGRKWKQRLYTRRGIMTLMIVRIQLAEKDALAILQSKDKSLSMTVIANPPLRARMQGKAQRFFDASVDNGIIEIGDAVPDQSW